MELISKIESLSSESEDPNSSQGGVGILENSPAGGSQSNGIVIAIKEA